MRSRSICKFLLLIAAALGLASQGAKAAPTFEVTLSKAPDEKAVFATVESRDVEPARVRTGGTITSLTIKEGDKVRRGQVLATVVDEKLALQRQSVEAQIAALSAQLNQAQADLARAQALIKSGAVSKAQLDQLTTATNVAASQLRARNADHAVLVQQSAEGDVLAPVDGRILKVPVTVGAFVMSGETIATLAQQDLVLRLQIPESYARSLKTGDPVRVDPADLAHGAAPFGTISLVYPQIENGRVIADAQLKGLGDYFVGERIRVWIPAGERSALIVPGRFIFTQFGLDYAHVRQADGSFIDVPVQRGQARPRPDELDALEILSGLLPGDVLAQP